MLDAVRAAAVRIATAARRTPLERSAVLSEIAGCDVLLKLECWQPTRSFKIRGAANAVASLSPQKLARGVVTASAGNHGQAVASAARAANARATIFVPRSAPRVKQERIRRLGAELRVEGESYDDAESRALAFAASGDRPFVHAFSDDAVIAGQGTVALELLEQCPGMREVIVPVGGGGLISGIGSVLKAVRPDVRVIGVQSTETRAMHAALAAGRVVEVPVPPTLADGLAGRTDDATFQRVRGVIDDLLLVTEDEIADAIRALFEEDGITAEGSAAVGPALLRAGRVSVSGPAVVIVTGGNIDGDRLGACLAPGRGTTFPL